MTETVHQEPASARGDEAHDTKRKPEQIGLGIRLTPASDSDRPILANYTAVNISPGMVFIDFGFLEPALLSALPRVVKRGGKLPETVKGRLAVRVAVGYDTLASLERQLSHVLATLRSAQQAIDRTPT